MRRLSRTALAVAAASLAGVAAPAWSRPPAKAAGLEQAYAILRASRIVDLTHGFAPGIPHWKGYADEGVETLFTHAKDGFLAQRFSLMGQWGTHVDAPVHFIAGSRSVDRIRPDEMILRLVVLDIHARAEHDPDYVVTLADVQAWERRHGPVPAGSFVALRTDWAKRWPDDAAMHNVDAKGVAHYPGWSLPVLKYLYEQRKVTATGHETTDTDPGIATTKDDYSLESYVLSTNHFQIELLANLDQVPEAGALIFVTFPKPIGASGFPARALAFVP